MRKLIADYLRWNDGRLLFEPVKEKAMREKILEDCEKSGIPISVVKREAERTRRYDLYYSKTGKR